MSENISATKKINRTHAIKTKKDFVDLFFTRIPNKTKNQTKKKYNKSFPNRSINQRSTLKIPVTSNNPKEVKRIPLYTMRINKKIIIPFHQYAKWIVFFFIQVKKLENIPASPNGFFSITSWFWGGVLLLPALEGFFLVVALFVRNFCLLFCIIPNTF